MTPYYEAEGIIIYHGDCREILPVPPCQALVTDPPFAFAGGISNGMSSQVSEQFFEHWWRDVADLITTSLTPTGSGFIWCDWRTAKSFAKGFEPRTNTTAVWRLAQMLYHYREMPGLGQPFRSSVDMIAYVRGPKHRSPSIPNTTHNWLSQYWYYGKHAHHPAEKSMAVARQLLQWCTEASDWVLDPFMGSGTTLLAAQALGVRAIGIEIEEMYCEEAVERLRQGNLLASQHGTSALEDPGGEADPTSEDEG